jgi:F0F1-type ATP synthase delta subunit
MTLSQTIAQTIWKHHSNIDDVVMVLKKYKLLPLLLPVKHHLEKIATMESKTDVVRIESPFPLSQESLASIIERTGSSTAKSEVTINKDLLAGWKARYQGKLYDGSAERIVNQLLH